MDKKLPSDIGERFRDEINLLSRQPHEHIWENLDKALDIIQARSYEDKFLRLRKRTILLMLLLIGTSVFSVVCFNTTKNKSNNYSLSLYEKKESSTAIDTNDNTTDKRNFHSTNHFTQKRTADENIATGNTVQKAVQSLALEELLIEKRGKTVKKGTKSNMEEKESATGNKIRSKDNASEKSVTGVLNATIKSESAEKKLPRTFHILTKDPIEVASENNFLQSSDKRQHKKKFKVSLTAFIAPDYSQYHLINDKYNNYDNKVGIAKRERSDLSSSVGILIGYKTGDKTTIQSGIAYSSTNISIDPAKIYAEKDNAGVTKYRYNTSSGYGYLLPSFSSSPAVGDSLSANGANHTLHYISIPIIAKYRMGNKKLTFNPGVGVILNFLTEATLTTDVEDRFNRETEYIAKLESIRKIGISLMFFPEEQYQLSKIWSISAMPYFKYALESINKGNIVKTHPYTIGMGIGAVYKF